MKFQHLSLIFLISLFFFSCTKDNSKPSYLIIDERSYDLDHAYIYEYSFDIENSTRIFNIQFTSDYLHPEQFIQFQIISEDNRDQRPTDAIYDYKFAPKQGLDFSYLQLGRNVSYNEFDEFDGGEFFFDNFCNTRVLEGEVDVQVGKRDYDITVEAYIVKNNDTIYVEAFYSGNLAKSKVDFLDYVPCQ